MRRCSSSRVVILAGAQIVAHSSLSKGAWCTREGRLFRAHTLTHLRTSRRRGEKNRRIVILLSSNNIPPEPRFPPPLASRDDQNKPVFHPPGSRSRRMRGVRPRKANAVFLAGRASRRLDYSGSRLPSRIPRARAFPALSRASSLVNPPRCMGREVARCRTSAAVQGNVPPNLHSLPDRREVIPSLKE